MVNCCNLWHPAGIYKLLNDWFNDPTSLIYKEILNYPKSLKCVINYKSQEAQVHNKENKQIIGFKDYDLKS